MPGTYLARMEKVRELMAGNLARPLSSSGWPNWNSWWYSLVVPLKAWVRDDTTKRRDDMAGFRGLLYTLAKLIGDYNAVKKGKVGQRVGRRATGKVTGKAMRKLFK